MITSEVRIWLKKVESNQLSYDDAMYEFSKFARYLTKEELVMLKKKLYSLY